MPKRRACWRAVARPITGLRCCGAPAPGSRPCSPRSFFSLRNARNRASRRMPKTPRGKPLHHADLLNANEFAARNHIIMMSIKVLALRGSRWGKLLVAVYVRQMATRTNLVETIFRSTEQGILALAAVRDGAGRPSDFRVIAANDGAARLLSRGTEELLWRLVSELQLGLSGGALFDRLSDR